jgi:hypothetical protein
LGGLWQTGSLPWLTASTCTTPLSICRATPETTAAGWTSALFVALSVERHRTYLEALASTGIVSELGRFKAKDVSYRCDQCGHSGTMVRHEEKETDVGIACRMLELCLRPAVNGIVVVSGDTDLVPARRTVGRLSQVPLYAMLPYRRYNNAFDNLVVRRFTLAGDHYRRHQFPASITLPSGVTIAKPQEWA